MSLGTVLGDHLKRDKRKRKILRRNSRLGHDTAMRRGAFASGKLAGGAVSLMRTRLQQLNPSPALSSQKLTPFKDSGISFRFERLSVVDVSVEIEVVIE